MRDDQQRDFVKIQDDDDEDATNGLEIQDIELYKEDEDRDDPRYTHYVLTTFVDAYIQNIPAVSLSIRKYPDRDDCFEITTISLGVFAKGSDDPFRELSVIVDTENYSRLAEPIPLMYAYTFKKHLEWAVYD